MSRAIYAGPRSSSTYVSRDVDADSPKPVIRRAERASTGISASAAEVPAQRVLDGPTRFHSILSRDLPSIYPAAGQAGTKEFGAAIRLLAEAEFRTAAAEAAKATGDDVGADYHLGLLRGLMPELFCCRTLGDSFGMLIAALHTALENRAGEALTSPQLHVINDLVKKLRQTPFMTFSRAVEIAVCVEVAGLDITPSGLIEFGQLLDDE